MKRLSSTVTVLDLLLAISHLMPAPEPSPSDIKMFTGSRILTAGVRQAIHLKSLNEPGGIDALRKQGLPE